MILFYSCVLINDSLLLMSQTRVWLMSHATTYCSVVVVVVITSSIDLLSGVYGVYGVYDNDPITRCLVAIHVIHRLLHRYAFAYRDEDLNRRRE